MHVDMLIRAEAAADVDASAATAYDILADYHHGHPAILPRRYFTGLVVERGGRGAGTIIRFGMKVMGSVNEARAEVAEPEPGRVLRETVLDDKGIVTSFTVDPLGDQRARVTITTTWPARGLTGFVERLFAPAMLRKIYTEELANLARLAGARRQDMP